MRSKIQTFRPFLFVALVAGCVPIHNNFSQQTSVQSPSLVDMYAESTSEQLKTKKEKAVIAATKDAVKEGLKDPSSAQFRKVRIVSWGNEKVVCGEINAKNSYGAYVGFKRFIGSPDGATIEPVHGRINSTDAQTFRELNQACSN